MISKLDYLIELKKLKSLNELVIEDNPVLVLKESNDILRCLPIKIKQKENRDQKTNKPTSPITTGMVSHTSSAGGNLLNKNLQATPNQTNNSNTNYYSNSLMKSNNSMNLEFNNLNINANASLNFNNLGNILGNSGNNVTSNLILNNNFINSGKKLIACKFT